MLNFLVRRFKLTLGVIPSIIGEHVETLKEILFNLDQTPLSFVSPVKYAFNPKCAKIVPIKGIGDKSQITSTSTDD